MEQAEQQGTQDIQAEPGQASGPSSAEADADKMPITVIVATIFIGLHILLNIASRFVLGVVTSVQEGKISVAMYVAIATSILGVLIVVGLIKRSRLAWQWGMYFGFIYGVLTLLGGLATIADGTAQGFIAGGIILFLGGILLAAAICLHQDSARSYFRLNCPICGRNKVRGGDFFFKTAVCKVCDQKF